MAAIKLVEEQSSYHIVWPQLAAVQVDNEFNPNVTRVSAVEGSSILLEVDVLPDNIANLTIITRLMRSAEDVIDDTDEATFLATSYMEDMMNSLPFSKARCDTLKCEEKPGVDYDNAHFIPDRETLLTLRAWLSCFSTPTEHWLWHQARVQGAWCRIPWHTGVSAEQYVRDGRERRYVPTSYQVLPGISRHRSISESRGAWADNYMTRLESPVMVPGVCACAQLIKEHDRAGSCADFLGDGCLSGVSTDSMERSYGGIFYQEAVRITHLLVRRMPISMMAMGSTHISTARRNGGNTRSPMGAKVYAQRRAVDTPPSETACAPHQEQGGANQRHSSDRL
jgi:hypothetical protein